MKWKTIDLFSGLGGIRKGFELTGEFENVLSADIDKYACMAYEHLYGESSANDVTSEEFKAKVAQTSYDVLLAGFPCQSFSIAGLRQGFADETRGTLFFDIADILRQTRPKAFLLENVKGLLTHNHGQTFQIICKVLNELEYKIVGVDFDANSNAVFNTNDLVRSTKDFGIPQRRARTFIMGFRKDLVPSGYEFPELPTCAEKVIWPTVSDLLEPSVEPKYYLTEQFLTSLKKHKERHAGTGFGYRVVNREQPELANTLTATGGMGKQKNLVQQPRADYQGLLVGKGNPINTEGIRNMTPLEWARLQGFAGFAFMQPNGADGFSFPAGLSETQQYKLLGNSVSIPVIYEMAKYLAAQLHQFEEKN